MATKKKPRPRLDASTIGLVHEKWINPKTREMWIHGTEAYGTELEGEEPGVEYTMSTKVIKNLHLFKHQSKTRTVIIHMQTCGGDWTEGMAIYDTIRAMPYPVTIISYTHARSMSSIILQAADRRVLMPNSYFLIHWGEAGTGGYSPASYSQALWNKKIDEDMLNLYVEIAYEYGAKFKGKSKKFVKETIENRMNKEGDVFFTPEEAVEWGFADEVFTKWPR